MQPISRTDWLLGSARFSASPRSTWRDFQSGIAHGSGNISMWPHQGACSPAEGAASGLQLAAVHHSGRPALVGRAAARAGAPAAPRGPEGRPGRGVVRGALAVAPHVPLRDEVWPLLRHRPAPAPLLSVHCTAKTPCQLSLHILLTTSHSAPPPLLSVHCAMKAHVKCPSKLSSGPSAVQCGLAPHLRLCLVASTAIHCGSACAQHQALLQTADDAETCVARTIALG